MVALWTGKAVGGNRRLNYNRNLGWAVPNRRYQSFVNDMTALFMVERNREVISEPVSVKISVKIPKRMDIDAIIKPVLDALERGGVILDDNQVQHIVVTRHAEWPGRSGDVVLVFVERFI